MASTVFLLSPAYCAGRRATSLLRQDSTLPMATRLRAGTLSLGDAFAFMSGLYFRGKIAYARAFGPAPGETLVITPTRGLLPPDAMVTADLIREFAAVDISASDARYRKPLERDLRALADRTAEDARVVLLGSVATGKYVDVLVACLGERLHFPTSLVGRGDMSRGGLLLRHAARGEELDYSALRLDTPRRGARPPRLEPHMKTRAKPGIAAHPHKGRSSPR
jgi:hypothetical protein